MNLQETMNALEAMGTEQNCKVYKRHGAGDNLFGVSFANLNKLKKQIKTDHALAVELWKTGNTDARCLAIFIADPARMSEKTLEAWLGDIGYSLLADLFAGNIASRHPSAARHMKAWMRSRSDFTGQVGWDLLAIRALRDSEITEGDLEDYLEAIERDIHQSANRTRYAMNNALIAIGMRSDRLRQKALAAARRIGKVEVDHGETNCKTPDAASYILKAAARKKASRN